MSGIKYTDAKFIKILEDNAQGTDELATTILQIKEIKENGIYIAESSDGQCNWEFDPFDETEYHITWAALIEFPKKAESKSGTKHDQGKPEMALLDSDFLEEVAKVLTFGKIKYAADNWRGGIGTRRLLSAALRHIFAYLKGEDTDPESGLSHLGHAGCCLMFAFWMNRYKPELDDRYKYGNS